MPKKLIYGLSLVLTSLLITSCGENLPSTDDGRKILEAAAEKTGCMKLSSFEKTNGQKQEIFGVKIYELEYKAEYEATGPCLGVYSTKFKNFEETPKTTQTAWDKAAKRPELWLPMNTKFPITGKVSFQQKENGWEGKKKLAITSVF
jgi:hypothetical protein